MDDDVARHHRQKVEAIVAQIQAADPEGGVAQVSHSGVSHFVPLPGDGRSSGQPIRLGDLNAVLEIDVESQICTAEPGVAFSDLVAATLPLGLIPAVVPELKGITIGGAVAGCSVEAMSYKVGGFHDSCLEYEIVTGTGEVLTCSPEQEPLVFSMMHGSYGTLAILTRLRFKLLPAKPFVKMTYRTFDTFDAFEAELQERCRVGDFEFVDAIIHGPKEHVLCLGSFVDEAPYVSDYSWMKIFYKSTRQRSEDYLTTAGYCFRYDTECHWLTSTVPGLESAPVRFMFGKLLLGSTNLIKWSRRLEGIMSMKRRPDVVCDVFIPSQRFAEFFRWYEQDFDFYPLWVIPYRVTEAYPWLDPDYSSGFGSELMIDCAVYGKRNNHQEIDYSQALEEKTVELNGIKTLISANHFTPETFWRVYNRENFSRVKQQLDPNGLFPEIYAKFHNL